MKKEFAFSLFFIVFLLLPLRALGSGSIELKVGETRTLSLSNPPSVLKGCIWTSSHPYDVVFDPTPSSYSTSVRIKAVNPIQTSAPCIIHCEYKYLELDPFTGQYTYQRSGFEDWYVYVKASDPTSVEITPASCSAFVGERVRLEAKLYPNGTSSNLDWWLDDTSIAYFNQTQNNVISVTGKKQGVVYAYVRTANGYTAKSKITFNSTDPTSITLTGPSSMIVGETKTLNTVISPNGASTTLTWESSNDNIIEVNNGVVHAKSKGKAKITVTTHNGKSDYCEITVKNAPTPPTSIKISPKLTLYNSFTKEIDVTFSPDDAESIITWSSSDSSIASVSSGKVTGKSAGKVTITATTANNLSASCEVTIEELPADLTPSKVQNEINNITNLLNRTANKVPTK